MPEARALSDCHLGSMIAPAGCGKTHIITKAISQHGGVRELVLTHTHAGVDALRRRFKAFNVPDRRHLTDTIAGWALRLAISFPHASGLPTREPKNHQDWNAVYAAAARLLGLRPIQQIVLASYSGVYIDEYQDCTVEQHAVVLALGEILPCRILGDPLQGIFSFGNNHIVDWETHVAPSFESIAGPTIPWRWANGAIELGDWLQRQRDELEAGREINLADAPISVVAPNDRDAQMRRIWQLSRDGGVVVIRGVNQQCHAFARNMRGIFSCVEPVDCDALFEGARIIESRHGLERAVAVLDFAGNCMTKVKTELRSIYNAFERGRIPNRNRCRHVAQLDALVAVSESGDLRRVLDAINVIAALSGACVFRRELLDEVRKALRSTIAGEHESLSAAVWEIRNQSRREGRKLPRCAVGTTLLVKGLEFDHVVVMDAAQYDRKNLYVAMTRGSKSLTIVSDQRTLNPRHL